MIKDLRYYSINQSIRIIKFHITWRYWFWRSRVENDSTHIEIPGEIVEGMLFPKCIIYLPDDTDLS